MALNEPASTDAVRHFTPEAYTGDRWAAEQIAASAKSEDWSKRILTSLAVANAAGLVAMASTVPDSGTISPWQLVTSKAFALGAAASAIAMFSRERYFSWLSYRYAWLAREPERFALDIKAQLIWRDRPLWERLFRPVKPAEGVDPRHPALTGFWWAQRWDALGISATGVSAICFAAALWLALWARPS